MPEPLAPFPGSPHANGAQRDAHREVAPDPAPDPAPPAEPSPSPPTSDPSQGDPLFWERRFDDLARPATRRREPNSGAVPWRDRLVDRARDLLADTRAGVVALVLVAVVAGFVWYRMGAGGEAHGSSPSATRSPVTTVAQSSTPVATDGGPPATSATGRIVVHVAGAVTKPGVVELTNGARVIDAIEAVGGALPDGDLDRLNLAAKVTDGERVYVGRPGVADPGAGVAGTGGTVDGAAAGSPGAKVNLNTATQAQLEELPGVGPAFAQAILAERERRGGFASVNDLRSVRGIGDKRFADLSPLVTV